jgi:hypothetical protein
VRDWIRWVPILAILYLSIGTSWASLKRQGKIWNDRSFVARDILAGMPDVASEVPPGRKAFILGLGEPEFGAMQGEAALGVFGFPPGRFILVGLTYSTLRDFEDAAAGSERNEAYCFKHWSTGFTNVTDQFRSNPEPFLNWARNITPFVKP